MHSILNALEEIEFPNNNLPAETLKRISMSTTALRLFSTLLISVLLSAGCGLPGRVATRTRALTGGKLDVAFTVAPQANQNTPVAVSMLLVYDGKLLEQLKTMPASQWFEKRAQIRENFPGNTGFESWDWEWVPGQIIHPRELPLRASAKAGIVFANYLKPGEHRAVFKPNKAVKINLREEGFDVEP